MRKQNFTPSDKVMQQLLELVIDMMTDQHADALDAAVELDDGSEWEIHLKEVRKPHYRVLSDERELT